ncbi:hypothetical protein [uncultured Bacteroides sp.]|uniref:hypothetical protein n=1 Tax=uncultured Bacteroides sp. TaxID=162156 RepID=UPI002591BC40|nr:hypothetical protein [uncultured Bacteroides sp.]
MNNGYVFSWAENAEGKMVHVDSVPRGLQCECVCPYCHEKLLARHGEKREHGFAHHSETRGAHLEICYMVILYKLAEQIIQTKKRIHVPSYYGIYKEDNIEFIDVKIDSRFEREDKQPDVIATTYDNQQYLIEFIFNYKVQHKQDIDYRNLTSLEIDLSNQTLETLEEFLLSSNKDRRWINNEVYFHGIEDRYRSRGKKVKVVSEIDCWQCDLNGSCCAVKQAVASKVPISIENNGQRYRLCKTELREQEIQRREEENLRRQQEREKWLERKKNVAMTTDFPTKQQTSSRLVFPNQTANETTEKSCFNCEYNLSWANKNGLANCGLQRPDIPKRLNPDYAQTCRMFKKK